MSACAIVRFQQVQCFGYAPVKLSQVYGWNATLLMHQVYTACTRTNMTVTYAELKFTARWKDPKVLSVCAHVQLVRFLNANLA